MQSCALQALDEADARALLQSRHAAAPLVPGIVKFAQGHPLALELALAAASERPGFDFEVPDRSRVMAHLAQLFLQDLADSGVRAALEYIREIGVANIAQTARPLVIQCLEELKKLPVELLTPADPDHVAGILAFRHLHAERIHAYLHDRNVHVMSHAGR